MTTDEDTRVNPGVRTALTLVVLVVLLVVGVLVGWTQLTKPLGAPDLSAEEPPACVDRVVEAGSKIGPGDVTVSVYNGGTQDGLAGRTLEKLANRGFGIGESGNSQVRVPRIQVWAEEPSPAVFLVRTHLGKKPGDVTVVRRAGLGPGVTVVVGDNWSGMKKGRRQLPVDEDVTICSPPDTESEPPA